MTSKPETIPLHILSDLCTRFIMNVPDVESQDVIRIFFQVQLAHWFFLDFYCQEDSQVKSCTLKEFCFIIFNFCPTLSKFRENFEEAYESWKNYKQAVPTYGAILLDPTLQYCLLVQGYWVRKSWSFAKGKVNQDESAISCAIREVLEETSYDIEDKIDPNNYIEKKLNEQLCRLYVVDGIPLDTKFQAQTRSEIKGIAWFNVDLLPCHKKDMVCRDAYQSSPNQFFTVIPFIKDLRKRILQMKSDRLGIQHTLTQKTSPHTSPNMNSTTCELNNKHLSKSQTQTEFFESLLNNSTKKLKGRQENSAAKQSFSTPQQPIPSNTLFHSQPTSDNNSHGDIISSLFSSMNLTRTVSRKFSAHDIKSLQQPVEPENPKEEKGLDEESLLKEIFTPFPQEPSAWTNFKIDVESYMTAVFNT